MRLSICGLEIGDDRMEDFVLGPLANCTAMMMNVMISGLILVWTVDLN